MGAANKAFAADVTSQHAPAHSFSLFRKRWLDQVAETYPAPAFTPGSSGDFRIRVRAVKAGNSVIADVRSESLVGTNEALTTDSDGQVLMHVVRRNVWRFARRRDSELAVPANHFMLQRSGPPTSEIAKDTAATVLILPPSDLGPQIKDRLVIGSAASAEMRLLLAHVHLLGESVGQLSPSGVQVADQALVVLVQGVLNRQTDAAEPLLSPTLAQAAKLLADSRLAEPDLSPSMLARELHVSVRTLHRAFASEEQTAAQYIRQRRLERARLDLLASAGRPNITEIAAHWCFADASHFTRAFKSQYGQTPTEFACCQS
ncbi:helix-turn-helix domain-containing protein [Actinacidiphila glaucinigra]|uniref:helix-turn-helix domain-containing protein n=1 Tax=Actinacidiphila glaucinigra TaxID=235986 RepID=UPI0033A4A2A9